jgi:hypothetical protein
MEGLITDDLVVRGRLVDKDKGKLSNRNSKSRGRYKSMFIRQEDVGNVVNLGIMKGTASRRKWKLVQDPTRSNRLRERQL